MTWGLFRFVRPWTPLAAQLVAAVSGLAVAVLAPPLRGTMLLVPLTSEARAIVAKTAIGHGALLLGLGPVRGSLIVSGDRRLLAAALLRNAIVPLAGSDNSCGGSPAGGRGV